MANPRAFLWLHLWQTWPSAEHFRGRWSCPQLLQLNGLCLCFLLLHWPCFPKRSLALVSALCSYPDPECDVLQPTFSNFCWPAYSNCSLRLYPNFSLDFIASYTKPKYGQESHYREVLKLTVSYRLAQFCDRFKRRLLRLFLTNGMCLTRGHKLIHFFFSVF